ncbi:protein of unassigned function [Methylobacterium oryzae CBMB20]|uniref:Protein of unassigned function n=1 Tax=Methylobacterium oryzae CBMB20 TaxID=693986 RepID=A0A089P0P2_9HYPH|nr:protein of unassigned function [Methylobacterium oryzae CBMB20]
MIHLKRPTMRSVQFRTFARRDRLYSTNNTAERLFTDSKMQ